ncbi:hypothetical protein ACIQ1D_19090 [Lysinibacillus xylanilyticus]|uniref:hypothetical protein n=1 Tax=Lysinibacillus xylanilyticus TaxID=582475 RepID=UPI00381575AA
MKFLSRKPKQPTNEEIVQKAKDTIQSSLSMFHSIHSNIEGANETLRTVISEENQRIADIQQNVSTAELELEGNLKLQEQLKVFVK